MCIFGHDWEFLNYTKGWTQSSWFPKDERMAHDYYLYKNYICKTCLKEKSIEYCCLTYESYKNRTIKEILDDCEVN